MVYAGNGIPKSDSTGSETGVVSDEGTHELLSKILCELEKINFYLMIMTNTDAEGI